jgi:hypothetical protein
MTGGLFGLPFLVPSSSFFVRHLTVISRLPAMAEYLDREHFIPLRKHDLMEVLLRDKQLPAQQRDAFRQFGTLVSATFHFEYLAKLEELKDAYAPFDPDADTTKPCKPLYPEERKEREDKVFASFASLMERANFRRLKRQEIEEALRQTPSDWGLHLDLDLNSVFERLEVYVRGDVVRQHSRRSWRTLWRVEKYPVPTYQRMALILKLRPSRRLDPNLDVHRLYLKVFKEVPKADVDMQLPGGRPRMTRLDRALVLWPLLLGLGLLLYHFFTQILGQDLSRFDPSTLASVTALGLAAGFCGYAYRSFHAYQTKRQAYVLQLVRSLYFKALATNSGALARLFDEAEEQECRETYLAYFCLLLHAPPQGWTPPQLDDYVEMYLEGAAGLKVDFEIGDALAKLERMRIVTKTGEYYRAAPLEKALEMLDWTWDNYFKFNNPEPETPPL